MKLLLAILIFPLELCIYVLLALAMLFAFCTLQILALGGSHDA